MRPRRRQLSEQARRDLITRQGDLTSLAKHPAWPTLEDEVERKQQRIEKGVLALALGGGDVPAPEKLAYWRGFIQGMRWFVAQPPAAENRLEAFLREHGLPTEEVSSEQ